MVISGERSNIWLEAVVLSIFLGTVIFRLPSSELQNLLNDLSSFFLPPAYVVRREGYSFTLLVCSRGGGGGVSILRPLAGGMPLAFTQEDFLVSEHFSLISNKEYRQSFGQTSSTLFYVITKVPENSISDFTEFWVVFKM